MRHKEDKTRSMMQGASPPSPRRRRAYHVGLWAEALCRWMLRLKGYRLLATRYRTPVGEVDIIAVRGRTLAFVEVKARTTRSLAAEAITPAQCRRQRQAAGVFLAHHPLFNGGYVVRFDAMLVAPFRWPVHLENADDGF